MNGAVIAILVKQRKYIRTFKNLNATTVANAIDLTEHGVRKSLIFDRLVNRGVIVLLNNNRYYLDEAKELEFKNSRRKVLSFVLVLLVVGLLVAWLTNSI